MRKHIENAAHDFSRRLSGFVNSPRSCETLTIAAAAQCIMQARCVLFAACLHRKKVRRRGVHSCVYLCTWVSVVKIIVMPLLCGNLHYLQPKPWLHSLFLCGKRIHAFTAEKHPCRPTTISSPSYNGCGTWRCNAVY